MYIRRGRDDEISPGKLFSLRRRNFSYLLHVERRSLSLSLSQTHSSFAPLSLCPEFLALKHESRILGHSSNRLCGFSMMEQVRLCAVWPMENWLGSSLNQIQGLDHCPRIILLCFRARTSVSPLTSRFEFLFFFGVVYSTVDFRAVGMEHGMEG